MSKQFFNEIIVSVVLVFILGFFWNPFDSWMPDFLVYILVAGLLVITVLYAGLISGETVHDEREEKIRAKAGRFGFLAGIIALSIGIVYQAVTSHIDPFLVLGLGIMVVVKMITYGKLL